MSEEVDQPISIEKFEEKHGVTWINEIKQTAVIILCLLGMCGAIFVITYFFANTGEGLDSRYQSIFMNAISKDNCLLNLNNVSSLPHLSASVGQQQLASTLVEKLSLYLYANSLSHVAVSTESFEVLLSTPTLSSSVSFIDTTTNTPISSAKLYEDVLPQDKQTDIADTLPARAWNAYSPNGTFQGNYYYVNYGSDTDFQTLIQQGVNLNGAVVIARYGSIFRGVKVANAEKYGCVAIVLYDDPADDGFVLGPVYPDGIYRPPSSIQRGSVEYLQIQPGDPTTPNSPSRIGTAARIPRSQALNLPQKTVVLPVSANDVVAYMAALGGNAVPSSWVGALPGVTYRFGGNGNNNRQLSVSVTNIESLQIITNIYAVVKGEIEPDKMVIVGNHYDAWIYGSCDAGSGVASVLETARAVGQLLNSRWRPRRTIVFAFWDAEEYSLTGSTEFVEENSAFLRKQAVAYINMDNNSGNMFSLAASPLLNSVVRQEAEKVSSPIDGNLTLAETWDQQARLLGSGSDYTAFYHHLGVSSLDMSFKNNIGSPGVYHSLYETNRYYGLVDPDGTICQTAATMMGLVTVRLAHDQILPFNLTELAMVVINSFDYTFNNNTLVVSYVNSLTGQDLINFNNSKNALQSKVTFFGAAAQTYANYIAAMSLQSGQFSQYSYMVRDVNDKLTNIDRAFTTQEGLQGRPWYKNVFVAPGLQTGYAPVVFPAIIDGIRANNLSAILLAFEQLIKAMEGAAQILENTIGDPTN